MNFAEDFLAAVDAERSKDAVAWQFEECVECPVRKLYLSPRKEGWKLVPVEPTDDMFNAGSSAIYHDKYADAVYNAMLAAAPTPEEGK